jgi:hypothetical protein
MQKMKPASAKESRHNPNVHPAKVPPNFCKHLKGSHEYHLWSETVWHWHVRGRTHKQDPLVDWLLIEERCTGCGKKRRRGKRLDERQV